MGFGRKGRIFSDLLSDIGIEREPTVVELVDQPDRIDSFIPVLHGLVRGRRLITLERAEIIRYAATNKENSQGADGKPFMANGEAPADSLPTADGPPGM